MPKCTHHPQTEMRLFQPQNGPAAYTCPTNVGVGYPNTNAKGYCNYRVAVNGQGPPQTAYRPQAGPGASGDARDRSIAIQACVKAACEATNALPWATDQAGRRDCEDWTVGLAKRLYREVVWPVMHPVPKAAPTPAPAPAPQAAPNAPGWLDEDPDADIGF